MRITFSLILIVVSFTAVCQGQSTNYYFDKDLNVTTKQKSIYQGSGRWNNDLYQLELYDKKSNYHIFSAFYTDSTFAVMDGRFISYYKNGVIENSSYYKKGTPDGLWVKWNWDGKLLDSVWYSNGKPDSSVIFEYNFLSKKLELTVRNNFIDSSSIRTLFDEFEKPLPGDPSDTTRKEDRIIFLNTDRKVEFAGGDSAMNKYFQYLFSSHKFELISNGVSGACRVKFIVDKNGSASNVVTLNCDNSLFARLVSGGVESIKWLPAGKDGKAVAAIKEISIDYYPSLTGLTADNEKKYYFDNNFRINHRNNAMFYGKVTSDDNLVKLTVHDNQHTGRIFSIHFTDSTLQTASGEFEKFNFDDQKQIKGNFLLGRKNGAWLRFDKSGRVIDSSIYNIGILTSQTFMEYQPEGGLTLMRVFDYNAATERDIFYNRKEITSDVTVPLNTSEEGDSDKIFTKPEIDASFPGGPGAWSNYINKYIEDNIGKIKRAGTCVVRFVVDTEGKISDVKALTLPGSSIAKTAINAIVNGPDWVPAMQHGIKVKAYRMQAITFY